MRKDRLIEQNRCYHLISRLAHRAFFRDDMEKDRAVALMRRVGFSRYCMTGLMEMGLVARTDPDNLMSFRREYRQTWLLYQLYYVNKFRPFTLPLGQETLCQMNGLMNKVRSRKCVIFC